MTAPQTADPDFRQPAWNSPLDEGLDYIRQNARFVMLCAISDPPPTGYAVIPGWQTSVSGSPATPNAWILTKGTMRIECKFVWDSSTLSTVQVCFDNGVAGGLVCFPPVAVASTTILWDEAPITVEMINPNGSGYPELEFGLTDGFRGFTYAIYQAFGDVAGGSMLAFEPVIAGTYSTGEYLAKYEVASVLSGSGDIQVNFSSGTPGVWYELDSLFIGVYDTTTSPMEPEHVILDITVAENDGTDNPLAGTARTKRCTLIGYAGVNQYLVNDNFTDTNGTALTSHSPDVGGTWVAHDGTFTIAASGPTRWAKSAGEARAVIDAGTADCVIKGDVTPDTQDCALIGRAVDANNYWELRLEVSGNDTTLTLIEHNTSLSPNAVVRDTATMEGVASVLSTDMQLRLVCDGDDITGQVVAQNWTVFYDEEGVPLEVSFNSSTFNSATLFGIRSSHTDVLWDQITITDIEIGLI